MALTALGMVLTPGPNMLYLVSRSVNQGRRAGLISLAGTAVGFLVYMTMANLGLAVMFVAVPWMYIGLKVAGVLYLAHLAWHALKPGGRGPFDVRPLHRDSAATLFRVGLLTNLLNPKTAVMHLALIPQFIDPSHGGTIAQGFTLGVIQIGVSIAVNAMLILGAGSISAFLSRRPSWTKWQRRITGSCSEQWHCSWPEKHPNEHGSDRPGSPRKQRFRDVSGGRARGRHGGWRSTMPLTSTAASPALDGFRRHLPKRGRGKATVRSAARKAGETGVRVADDHRPTAQELRLGLQLGHELLRRTAEYLDRLQPDEWSDWAELGSRHLHVELQ